MMKNINGKTLKIVLIMSFYIWSMVAVAAAAEDTTSQEPIIAMTIKADASGAVSFSLRQGWQLANMAAKTINCEVKVTKE